VFVTSKHGQHASKALGRVPTRVDRAIIAPPSQWLSPGIPALSALCAAISWSQLTPEVCAALTFVPLLLWMLSRDRLQAGLVMALYLAGAGTQAPIAVQTYTGIGLLPSVLGWLAYCGLFGLIWAAAWRPSMVGRACGSFVALLVTTLPPLGVFFYGSVLTFAGVFFPSTGLWGLLAGVIAVFCLTHCLEQLRAPQYLKNRWPRLTLCALLLMSVGLNLHEHHSPPPPSLRVKTSQTVLGPYPAATDQPARYARHFELLQEAKKFLASDKDFLLLPEGVAGLDEPRFRWLWQDLGRQAALKQKSIVVGASSSLQSEQLNVLSNIAFFWGEHEGQVKAQVPVPVGSWRPWDAREHYPMTVIGRQPQLSVRNASGQMEILGFVFCWEELVAWSWIRHHLDQTSLVFILSNTWFDPSGQINAAQLKSSWAWARLTALPWYRSVNLPVANAP